jgi:ATP-dependent DNA helicase RecG
MDLKIRGAGEVFGRKQSGRFELKIASLADLELIEEAKQAAIKILSEDSRLDKYPWFKLKLGQLITSPSPD